MRAAFFANYGANAVKGLIEGSNRHLIIRDTHGVDPLSETGNG
jgi:hypothetical protein